MTHTVSGVRKFVPQQHSAPVRKKLDPRVEYFSKLGTQPVAGFRRSYAYSGVGGVEDDFYLAERRVDKHLFWLPLPSSSLQRGSLCNLRPSSLADEHARPHASTTSRAPTARSTATDRPGFAGPRARPDTDTGTGTHTGTGAGTQTGTGAGTGAHTGTDTGAGADSARDAGAFDCDHSRERLLSEVTEHSLERRDSDDELQGVAHALAPRTTHSASDAIRRSGFTAVADMAICGSAIGRPSSGRTPRSTMPAEHSLAQRAPQRANDATALARSGAAPAQSNSLPPPASQTSLPAGGDLRPPPQPAAALLPPPHNADSERGAPAPPQTTNPAPVVPPWSALSERGATPPPQAQPQNIISEGGAPPPPQATNPTQPQTETGAPPAPQTTNPTQPQTGTGAPPPPPQAQPQATILARGAPPPQPPPQKRPHSSQGMSIQPWKQIFELQDLPPPLVPSVLSLELTHAAYYCDKLSIKRHIKGLKEKKLAELASRTAEPHPRLDVPVNIFSLEDAALGDEFPQGFSETETERASAEIDTPHSNESRFMTPPLSRRTPRSSNARTPPRVTHTPPTPNATTHTRFSVYVPRSLAMSLDTAISGGISVEELDLHNGPTLNLRQKIRLKTLVEENPVFKMNKLARENRQLKASKADDQELLSYGILAADAAAFAKLPPTIVTRSRALSSETHSPKSSPKRSLSPRVGTSRTSRSTSVRGEKTDNYPVSARGEKADNDPVSARGKRTDNYPASARGKKADNYPVSARGEKADRYPEQARSAKTEHCLSPPMSAVSVVYPNLELPDPGDDYGDGLSGRAELSLSVNQFEAAGVGNGVVPQVQVDCEDGDVVQSSKSDDDGSHVSLKVAAIVGKVSTNSRKSMASLLERRRLERPKTLLQSEVKKGYSSNNASPTSPVAIALTPTMKVAHPRGVTEELVSPTSKPAADVSFRRPRGSGTQTLVKPQLVRSATMAFITPSVPLDKSFEKPETASKQKISLSQENALATEAAAPPPPAANPPAASEKENPPAKVIASAAWGKVARLRRATRAASSAVTDDRVFVGDTSGQGLNLRPRFVLELIRAAQVEHDVLETLVATFSKAVTANKVLSLSDFTSRVSWVQCYRRLPIHFERLFSIFDVSMSGEIGLKEFVVGMALLRRTKTMKNYEKERLDLIMTFCDVHGNGSFGLQELLKLCTGPNDSVYELVALLKELLQVLDPTGSGRATREGLLEAAHSHSLVLDVLYGLIPAPAVFTSTATRNKSFCWAVVEFDLEVLVLLWRSVQQIGHNGQVNRVQFRTILRQNFSMEDPLLCDRYFDVMDTSGDNLLDFQELLAGLAQIFTGSLAEKIAFFFRVYDLDNSGELSRDELLDIVERRHQGPVDMQWFDAVFDVMDDDGSGSITSPMFVFGVLNNTRLYQLLFGD